MCISLLAISCDKYHTTRANDKKGDKVTDRIGREWYKWELCVLLAILFCRILSELFFFSPSPPTFTLLSLLFLNLLRALSACRNFPRRDIHSRSRSVSAFSLTFIWNWNEIETSIRSQSDLGHTSPVSSSSHLYLLPSCGIKPFLIHYLYELLVNEMKPSLYSCGFPLLNISTKF